jgi:predicted nucleotidyltransferase
MCDAATKGLVMRRDDVLKTLRENRAKLSCFPIRSLAVFGSVARDEATSTGDVDILVEFEPEAGVGLLGCVSLKEALSELLGCDVDLATPAALREEMRDEILREPVRAA